MLEGQIDVTFRGETTTVGAGEVVNIPARAPHFFHNSSDADSRMLCIISPPGLRDREPAGHLSPAAFGPTSPWLGAAAAAGDSHPEADCGLGVSIVSQGNG